MSREHDNKKPIFDINYIAKLARLKLDPSMRDKLQKDMKDIVGYINLLGELDLEGVEPTAHPVPSHNVWRDDIAGESFSQDVMLRNAPEVLDDELYRVPRVLPGEENM